MNLQNISTDPPKKRPVTMRPTMWSEIVETLKYICAQPKGTQTLAMQKIFSRVWEGIIFEDDSHTIHFSVTCAQPLLRTLGLRAKPLGQHWVLVASGRPSSCVRLPPLSVSAPTIPITRPIQMRCSLH